MLCGAPHTRQVARSRRRTLWARIFQVRVVGVPRRRRARSSGVRFGFQAGLAAPFCSEFRHPHDFTRPERSAVPWTVFSVPQVQRTFHRGCRIPGRFGARDSTVSRPNTAPTRLTKVRAELASLRRQPHDFVLPLRKEAPITSNVLPQSQRTNQRETFLRLLGARESTSNRPNLCPVISLKK